MDYDYIFKVCFLGQGNVGKTSLILRYTQNAFIEDYKPTLGTDFAIKKLSIGGRKIALQIWDLAGQEHFNNIRSFYSKGASAGVLVFDVTRPDTFLTIKQWHDQFKRDSAPNGRENRGGKVFVVANKADLGHKRLVPPQVGDMIRRWLNIGYYETSAKSGKNVEALFVDIAKSLISALE
ncbi:MAG: Rab family GTPase [Candidatus Ranarchaeia archaeon]